LEHTIPLYQPDVGLLFGRNGNGDAGHSPLSASWSAVLPEDSQIPLEDERITFSTFALYNTNEQHGLGSHVPMFKLEIL
jgi:hypothetical protein